MHLFGSSSIVAVVSQVGVVAATNNGNLHISGMATTATTRSESGVSSSGGLVEMMAKEERTLDEEGGEKKRRMTQGWSEPVSASQKDDAGPEEVVTSWKIGFGSSRDNKIAAVLEILAMYSLCLLLMITGDTIFHQLVFLIGKRIHSLWIEKDKARKTKQKRDAKEARDDEDDEHDEEESPLVWPRPAPSVSE